MVIGVTVEENIVGIIEALKPVEMGCGDGDEPRKFIEENIEEVILASVFPSDTVVIFGVVDVVAAGHRTHI